MVDGAAHKAGLQLSRHLIITCYTVEWMYTYVSTYTVGVPMRLTGGTTVSLHIKIVLAYTVYIYTHTHTQAMFRKLFLCSTHCGCLVSPQSECVN